MGKRKRAEPGVEQEELKIKNGFQYGRAQAYHIRHEFGIRTLDTDHLSLIVLRRAQEAYEANVLYQQKINNKLAELATQETPLKHQAALIAAFEYFSGATRIESEDFKSYRKIHNHKPQQPIETNEGNTQERRPMPRNSSSILPAYTNFSIANSASGDFYYPNNQLRLSTEANHMVANATTPAGPSTLQAYDMGTSTPSPAPAPTCTKQQEKFVNSLFS